MARFGETGSAVEWGHGFDGSKDLEFLWRKAYAHIPAGSGSMWMLADSTGNGPDAVWM